MSEMAQNMRLAICLYPEVTSLDYQGPMQLFANLTAKYIPVLEKYFKTPPAVTIEPFYLAPTLDPIVPDSGPNVLPTATYDTQDQFDIILVPGGSYLEESRSDGSADSLHRDGVLA